MSDELPFDEQPNVAAITTVNILERVQPIVLVTHDLDDGGWQFLCGATNDPEDGRVVGLDCIVRIDPTVGELADLPAGWIAWRERPGEHWHRALSPRPEGAETIAARQRALCERYGAEYLPSDPEERVGVARDVVAGAFPIHGVRHLPRSGTTGWYFWAGGEPQTDLDFFESLHVAHLGERCPELLPYLALGPGWRFLIAPDHEDVWYDASVRID